MLNLSREATSPGSVTDSPTGALVREDIGEARPQSIGSGRHRETRQVVHHDVFVAPLEARESIAAS
jgi:hypothetical protein